MDIKLKNSHRLAVIIAALVILLSSVGMVLSYRIYSDQLNDERSGESVEISMILEMASSLIEGNAILYNEVYEETDPAYVLQEYGNDRFQLMRKFMDYEVFDYQGKALLTENGEDTLAKLVKKDSSEYAFRAAFTYDDSGELKDIRISGSRIDEREQFTIEQNILGWQQYDYSDISEPARVQIIYGMTEKNLDAYLQGNQSAQYYQTYHLLENSTYTWMITLLVIVVMLTGLFLTVRKSFAFGTHQIFAVPFEIVICVLGILAGFSYMISEMVWLTISGEFPAVIPGANSFGNEVFSFLINLLVWLAVFTVVFWGSVCLSHMFTMKKAYWRERTLCARFIRWTKRGGNAYGKKVKDGAGGIWSRFKSFCSKQYDAMMHLDFRDKTNRTIFKIVAINFVVLIVICTFWFYGFIALVIYSVVLFLFLRKYFSDIQEKYKLLLRSTNQLAEGDLDTPLTGDMGIFNPIQGELIRIQKGFKKAVEEEVKSERMKTELITNVSHDLKTPLTAIITYTDLLKNETDEAKRKEYIEVLDKKSLRLKVLIEDLFEISKATSRNVTMNFMDVDIVGLLKQVGLEYDNKIQESNLDFRWKLPDHKIVLWLDSQKTYRIFENMIVNITKYAMPHTRVYIEMQETDREVSISMKNISASELNFNTEEITDRFVRGDSSRNTEGSGLGLAIAKSFTELQYGTLKISTEADLFKAEITLPKRESPVEVEPRKTEELKIEEPKMEIQRVEDHQIDQKDKAKGYHLVR